MDMPKDWKRRKFLEGERKLVAVLWRMIYTNVLHFRTGCQRISRTLWFPYTFGDREFLWTPTSWPRQYLSWMTLTPEGYNLSAITSTASALLFCTACPCCKKDGPTSRTNFNKFRHDSACRRGFANPQNATTGIDNHGKSSGDVVTGSLRWWSSGAACRMIGSIFHEIRLVV